MLFQLFLGKLGELVLSKVVDKTADKALIDLNNIKEFELILKYLHKSLKLLSAMASDVEEEVKNGERSGRKKRKREVEEWLEQVKSIQVEVDGLGSEAESEGFVMRLMDGGKAARLNEQAEKLVQQRRDFGDPLLDSRGTKGEILLTNEMVGRDFNDNFERILKLLEDRQVSMIGVYGMGGVGKTTLAKHIHNRLMQQPQGRVFWITVSQEFTIKSLQDKLARCLGLDLSDEDEEALRAGMLNRFLCQMKNSVLILDDMWENIDMKKVGCTFSAEYCRLIITTRSSKVCDQIGCKKVHVQKLRKNEAWNLFYDTLGNERELGPQVEEIARSMAKECDGLPLGIITIAGSMKGETTVHTWRNALAELKDCVRETGEVDEVFKVLKYSFDRLNKNYPSESNEFNMVQLCFLYCSLYPEDCIISRTDLVNKLVSEGLMDERKSWRARVDQGHSILDKLVDVCLLEICVVSYDNEAVKMHDLVRSMALKICEGKYMVRAGDYLKEIPYDLEWTKDLEKVSFMSSGIGSIREGLSPDCPKLSTLLLSGNDELGFIPESFFSKMQRLCTLDMCGATTIRMLPDSISDLTCLKTLLLEGCKNLEKVSYLGKLKALRRLNLSGTAIEEVPGIDELVKLEFLSLKKAYRLKKIPRELLVKLVHLRNVKFPFHIKAPIDGIQNQKLLEKFHGRVGCVEEFNHFIRSGEIHDIWYTIIVAGDENKVRSSTTYKKELGLFGCNLEDERVLGHDVELVLIKGCEGLSISFLDDFSWLKALSIQFCGGIEWILRSDGHGSQFSNTLEQIELYFLDDLKGVVMERGEIGPSTTWQPPAFSSLRELKIVKCDKIRKVGIPVVSGLPNLEVLHFTSCGEIEEIFEEDEGIGASILTTLTLPKLRKLSLYNLPRLKSVSKTTIICNSISVINIKECPRLIKKLPVHFNDPTPPPTLRGIYVEREWWESLEWDYNINPTLPRLLQDFVRFEDWW